MNARIPYVRRLLIAVLATFTLTGLGFGAGRARWGTRADTPATATVPLAPERVAALLKAASEGHVTLDKVLPETQVGFTGAVAKASDGRRFVVWISPQADALAMGALFDAHGANLTRAAMQTHHVVPAEPQPETPRPIERDLLGAIAQATAVQTGAAGPEVYVFIDLNCHFCSSLYQQLAPSVTQGKLRVHWIPVAILDESSLSKAAELLQAPSPAATLADHETHRDSKTGEGGLTGRPPTRQTQLAIQANTELLKVVNQGTLATPVLLFRGQDGKIFQHAGLLRDVSDILAAAG